MRRRLPPMNALLAFEAAARHGNFSRAARDLGVAQPSITRHVANLEAWLGLKLFQRSGPTVQLTQDGEEIAFLATTALDRLEIGLSRLQSRKRDEVVIGASFGMTHLWLMPQITAIRDAALGASVNFITSENYADFDSERVDLAIRFGDGTWPGLRATRLFADITYVVAAPDFLRKHPEIDPENLPGTLDPAWLLEHGDPFDYGWLTWRRWYRHLGAVEPAGLDTLVLRNYATLLDMVRCGEGVGLGFVGIDDGFVASGDIVRIGPPTARPDFGYYITASQSVAHAPSVQSIAQYLAPDQADG